MSKYQYPALTDEKEFESLINDLCKKEFDLNSFQLYGRKGQKQNGIDGISLNLQKNLIVHQCKNKLLNREDKKIQEELINDLIKEVKSAKEEFIDKQGYTLEYFIFANSFKQDKEIQNKALELTKEYGFNVIIWSWDQIEDMLEKFRDTAKQYYPYFFDKNIFSIDEIKYKFKINSSILASSSSIFIENSFINIDEHSLIENFIYRRNEENLLVVTGKAGIGKTALLSKIQKDLEEKELSFLSIKADRITIENKKSLSDFFEVDNLLNTIRQISLSETVVILIDQLDALSLNLSSDRNVINIVLEFIEQLKRISNVNIIVSLREYDLKNDPLLSNLNNDNIIYLNPFPEEYIRKRLKKIISQTNKLSNSLVELLRLPLNLSLFLELYKTDNDCLSIKTLQDLYKKFWEQKIQDKTIDKILKNNSIKLLDLIVSRMSSTQKIEVPIIFFEDDYSEEISLLLSKGILINDNEKLTFFHQTFYDFIFAKNFIKNENSLFKYILSIEQTLEIREQVKQIFEFLRGSDEDLFLEEVELFLNSDEIRLHIKLLIFSYLGNLENPNEEEFKLLEKLFKVNLKYEQYFIESWISSDWIEFFIKTNFFKKENFDKYNLQYKLETFVNKIPDKVFDILDSYDEDKKLKEDSIIQCLSKLEKWNDNALLMLKKYKEVFYVGKDYRYARNPIFKKLYKYDKKYAEELFIGLLNIELKDLPDLEKREIINRDILDIFEKILIDDSLELYIGILSFFESISKKRTKKYSKKEYIIEDDIFESNFMFQFKSTLYSIWDLYRQTLDRLLKIAKNNKELFNEIYKKFNSSKYMSIINFKIFVYFEDVENYKSEIFELLIDKKLLSEIDFHWENGFKLMKIISKSYSLYTEKEKNKILDTLISIIPNWEKRRWRKESTYYGFTKYKLLLQLPVSDIKRFNYYKEFQELQRKFSSYVESEPKTSKYSLVGTPLSSEVYNKMTLKNWLQSMTVFNDVNKRDNSFLRRSKTEHSREFEKQIKENPEKFYKFLFEIKDNEVIVDYLSSGLTAFIESKIDNEKLFKVIIYYSDINDSWLQRQIIKGIKKLLNNNYFNILLLDILEENKNIKYAEIIREEGTFQSIHDYRTSSINSYEGDFSSILPLIFKIKYKDTSIKKRVLKLIEEVIEQNTDFVMFEFIDKLSYISQVDKKLYSELICKIIKKDKSGQLSLSSLSIYHYLYQNNLIDISKLIEVFDKSIKFVTLCKDKEDAHSINDLGMFLFFYFVNNNIEEDLLHKAIYGNKQVVFGILRQIFEREILSNDDRILKICKKNILRFKNDEENEFYYRYELKNLDKLDLVHSDFNFLKELSKSMNIKRESKSFVNYLRTEYYKDTTILNKILELLEINIQSIMKKGKEKTYYFDNKELIEFIIELYSRMKSKIERDKILDLLDSFLKNDGLRYSTKNLIE